MKREWENTQWENPLWGAAAKKPAPSKWDQQTPTPAPTSHGDALRKWGATADQPQTAWQSDKAKQDRIAELLALKAGATADKPQTSWKANSWGAADTSHWRKEPFQRVFRQPDDVSQDLMAAMNVEIRREELLVKVEGDAAQACAPIETFKGLDLFPDYVVQALNDSGRHTPMPIQAQALPIVLAGHDLIGIAKTGSGKTLAFLLPAIVHIEAQKPLAKDDASPICLILAPTRELVAQIAEEAGKLTACSQAGRHGPRGIYAQEVYGGKQRQQQLAKCYGAALIAATPGRLADFVNSGDLSLDRVTFFVLDEADRMLDLGFQGDIELFSGRMRADRHTLFFSATWPKAVQMLASDLCMNAEQPIILRVGQSDDGAGATRADIYQKVVVFDEYDWGKREEAKKTVLYTHLRQVLKEEGTKCLVFVGSKTLADELATTLANEGFKTDAMHGGRKQWDRDEVLARFKRDEFRLLVATDVMGRGLDIPSITHVVVFDMGDIDDYVHRIGRTARGNSGLPGNALTLFEYNKKWPELAEGLVKVLERSQQEVPDELRKIAYEVASGKRDMVDRTKTVAKPTKTAMARINAAERKFDAAGKPICNYFLEGCCTKEGWCEFSHGNPAAGAAGAAGGSKDNKKPPCKHFQEGNCNKGESCWFAHGPEPAEEGGLAGWAANPLAGWAM